MWHIPHFLPVVHAIPAGWCIQEAAEKMVHSLMRVLIVALILAVTATAAARPVQHSGKPRTKVEDRERSDRDLFKRLILKDGSYEPISEYEIKGQVVRYLSSERHEWEEVPYSLVDWAATEIYAKETASERQARRAQSAEADVQERAEEEAISPWVALGIRLPESGGVFLLDTFMGRRELNQLHQNGANINRNTGGNILRGVINPVASAKRTIELPGARARVQAHTADFSIYVALDSGGDPSVAYTPETAKDHFRIVRCENKKDKRIVGVISIAVYGKVNQNAAYVETKVEPLLGNWIKVTSASPLPTGEYALVELLGKEGMNTLVWDFGVNPSAPANTRVRTEEPAREDSPPILQKRKRRTDADR